MVRGVEKGQQLQISGRVTLGYILIHFNFSNERGVTFVKGSIHVRFMGQTDNKA